MTEARQLGMGGKITVALWLTGVGGFVDAVGYIALFQIFTANMSGNSVHVGMYLGGVQLSQLLRPACAIASYMTGMVLTRIAIGVAGRKRVRRIASLTLAVEAVLLILFANATPGMHLGRVANLSSGEYFGLVALLAFAMGVQTATLTHFGPLTLYTTFVTGTLTKLAESFVRLLLWGHDELRETGRMSEVWRRLPAQQDSRDCVFLLSLWTCYVVGAAFGTVSKHAWELQALYVPVIVLTMVIVVDRFRPIDVEEEKRQQG